MRRFPVTLAVLCLSALSATAYADTLGQFDLQSVTFSSGATATGSIIIDTDDGVVQSLNITYTNGATSVSLTNNGNTGFNGDQSLIYTQGPNNASFLIDVNAPSLVGFTGAALCSSNATCDGYAGFISSDNIINDDVQTGSLAYVGPYTPTPEPSSLAFLATGALGLAATARRRFQQR